MSMMPRIAIPFMVCCAVLTAVSAHEECKFFVLYCGCRHFDRILFRFFRICFLDVLPTDDFVTLARCRQVRMR